MIRNYRSGFSIIEVALSLMIISIVTIGVLKQLQSTNRAALIQKELDYKATVDNGMKISFEQILDSFEPICSNIASDASTKWGWGHNSCNNTSPFSTFVAPNILRYNIQFSSLSAQDRASLENAIVGAFAPYCTLKAKDNSKLDLQCVNLSAMQYDLGAGAVASAHTVGSDIDPSAVPVATITLQRHEGDGTVSSQNSDINFLDVYEKRRNFSLEKFNAIRNVMKTYYNTQLSLEVANAPSTGLNSTDDEFVPWQWKMFGDSTSSVLGSVCDLAGGNTCSNLNTNNIWRNSLSGIGLYMRRVTTNLFNGDVRLTIDGFGNQITLYPLMSQCGNNDISTCGTTAPAIPQKDYFNIMRPPYMSALYINTYKDKSVVAPPYGRAYVSY